MGKKIDLSRTVYDLTTQYPELIEVLAGLAQFGGQTDNHSEGSRHAWHRNESRYRCFGAARF